MGDTTLLRCVLHDRPGSLGRIAAVLGELDVDIRSIGVSSEDDGRVVDELVVVRPDDLDDEELERRLRAAGAVEVALRTHGEVEGDPTARGLRLAASLARSGAVEQTLAYAVRVLVDADDAWVVPVPQEPPTELLAQSARSRIPVSESGASVRGRTGGADTPWVLSVPSPRTSARPHLAVALRAGSAFTSGEIERVTALLGLVETIEASRPTLAAEVEPPDPGIGAVSDRHPVWERVCAEGQRVTIRAVRGDDALGILRMHARCSDRTLRRRFFAALPSMPMRKLRWFTRSDHRTHLGFVAVVDAEIVGIAQLVSASRPDEAELGMLVEDAFQRRGLGRLLFERLVAAGRDAGCRVLMAELLAENTAMLGLLERSGLPLEVLREAGGIRVRVELSAPRRQALATGS